jgi:hypothetical protein
MVNCVTQLLLPLLLLLPLSSTISIQKEKAFLINFHSNQKNNIRNFVNLNQYRNVKLACIDHVLCTVE